MKSLIRTHKGRRCEVVYMLATTDEFELPLFVSNDMRDIAERFGISLRTCYRSANERTAFGRQKGFRIERIFLPMEGRRGCHEWD